MNQSFLIRASSRRQEWLFSLLLVLAVILVYLPVWHATFIWDDAAHLTENPVIVGPQGLKEIWTTRAARICPLTLTTFWIEHALWGLRPLPYHLVNVLFHAASALLLCRVLRRLGMAAAPAWLGAAMWALHPVQVETVSWITEMKNTESCFFFLLGILFFLRWLGKTENRDWRPYLFALICGAAAMASKSSTVILPIVLGLCAWWMEGRWKWRNLLTLAPFFAMTLIASGISIWTQRLEGTSNAEWALSNLQRVVLAGKVIWFYLGKLFWPHPLMLIYPQWKIDPGHLAPWLFTLTAGALFIFLWWKRRTGLRPFFFAYAYFLTALLPVLGLIDHTFLAFSFVGDHFQYLASMGPLALAAIGLSRLVDGLAIRASQTKAVVCAALLLLLGILSWQHANAFRDPETLWTDVLQKNPECEIACINMATIVLRKGDEAGAAMYYERTLRFKPDSMAAHNNLAWILATTRDISLRDPGRALTLAKEAEQISHGNNAMVLRTLAAAYAGLGQFSEAQATAQQAITLAEKQGKTNVAQQIQGDLDRYNTGSTVQ